MENCVFGYDSVMIAAPVPFWATTYYFSGTSRSALYPWKSLVVGTKLKLMMICFFFPEEEYSGRTRWEEILSMISLLSDSQNKV